MSKANAAMMAVILAVILAFGWLPNAAFAQSSTPVLMLSAAQRHDAGVKLRALPLVRTAPTQPMTAIVRNAAPILVLRASWVQQQARAGLARQQASRAEALYRAGHNIAQAQLQRAEAARTVAVARLDALRARAIGLYGKALGAAIMSDQARGAPALTALAQGAPLIELVFATPQAADGVAAGWTRIGEAGLLPAGLTGVPVYFYGTPDEALPAGAALRLAVRTGPAQAGYQVPASALIYRRKRVLIFVQQARAGEFQPVSLAVGRGAISRGDGRLHSLFVPQAALPAQPLVVVSGAGLLRSMMVTQGR
jgi:hypothetical protein